MCAPRRNAEVDRGQYRQRTDQRQPPRRNTHPVLVLEVVQSGREDFDARIDLAQRRRSQIVQTGGRSADQDDLVAELGGIALRMFAVEILVQVGVRNMLMSLHRPGQQNRLAVGNPVTEIVADARRQRRQLPAIGGHVQVVASNQPFAVEQSISIGQRIDQSQPRILLPQREVAPAVGTGIGLRVASVEHAQRLGHVAQQDAVRIGFRVLRARREIHVADRRDEPVEQLVALGPRPILLGEHDDRTRSPWASASRVRPRARRAPSAAMASDPRARPCASRLLSSMSTMTISGSEATCVA